MPAVTYLPTAPAAIAISIVGEFASSTPMCMGRAESAASRTTAATRRASARYSRQVHVPVSWRIAVLSSSARLGKEFGHGGSHATKSRTCYRNTRANVRSIPPSEPNPTPSEPILTPSEPGQARSKGIWARSARFRARSARIWARSARFQARSPVGYLPTTAPVRGVQVILLRWKSLTLALRSLVARSSLVGRPSLPPGPPTDT